MAEGLNRVICIGNLGQDAELRFTQSNTGVLTCRVAASESYFDKESNERKEATEWITCVIWGKRAEALSKILHKGSRVCIEGKLRTRTFEDKQGVKQYRTEVVANNVILLDSKGGEGGQRRQHTQKEADPAPDNGGGWSDDDIPFMRFEVPL